MPGSRNICLNSFCNKNLNVRMVVSCKCEFNYCTLHSRFTFDVLRYHSNLILNFLTASVNKNKVMPVNINVCFHTFDIPSPFIITASTIS